MQIQKALAMFVLQLEADGRSPHTIGQYKRHVRLLASWLGDMPIEKVDHETLAAFLSTPVARCRTDGVEKKATAMNALRSSLRCFFAFLNAAGIVPANPARLIRRAICSGPPPRGLSTDEQAKLLAELADAPLRDRILFRLMLRTGIRIGSALALRADDVDLEECELRLRAKGGREIVAFFPPDLRDDLRVLMSGGRLFPITARHARRRFHLLLERAGIRRRGPHALRHAFAMRVYQTTGDLLLTKEALGHRSITSTAVYARANRSLMRALVVV